METEAMRYILFLIDSKVKQHDGLIFCSYDDALDYARECIEEKYCNKAVIGLFVMEKEAEHMPISMVETIGFVGDKKNVNQLELFKRR
jgi:hypothetical protein